MSMSNFAYSDGRKCIRNMIYEEITSFLDIYDQNLVLEKNIRNKGKDLENVLARSLPKNDQSQLAVSCIPSSA